MAKKSIKKNYIYNVSYQILLLLIPLITTPYLSRVLGADGVGTASYIESVMSYFTLIATMGMTTFGQREVSYLQNDKESRTKVFWEVKLLEIFSSILCIGTYIIFSLNQTYSSLYFVLIFNLLSVIANVTWLFQGMEEFGRIVFRNIIFKIINIIYVFLVVRTKDDLIWYLFGLSFFALLSNLSLWFQLPQFVGLPQWSELKPLRHMKVVISLFIPTMAIQIYTVLDKTMIGVITRNSFENGYYEQAIKISRMVLTLVTSLGTVMIPRIGHHFEQNEQHVVKQLMYRGYRFVWFLGIPLCFGLMMVSSSFVPWFFGEGYDQVIPLLSILALLILAIGINNVTGMQYLIPTKRQNVFTITVIVGAVTNFVFNAIFIPLFQSIGAAIASVLAETTIAVTQLIIVRKELSMWIIIKEGVHYYIAGGMMVFVLWLVRVYLSPSVFHTAVIVVCGAIVYFAALLIMKDEFLLSNARILLKKLKRVK